MVFAADEDTWILDIYLDKDESDLLLDVKEGFIQERDLRTHITLPLSSHSMAPGIVNEVLLCARVLQLTQTEFYFLESTDSGPFSPRNEIQALSSVATAIARATPSRASAVDPAFLTSAPASHQKSPATPDDAQGVVEPSRWRSEAAEVHPVVLQLQSDLVQSVHEQLDDFCRQEKPVIGLRCKGDAEADLCAWAAENGCVFAICPADFPNTGRGAAASKDLLPGDVAVEVPEKLLIHSGVAKQSPLGVALLHSGIPMESDTISLLWTIQEQADPHSRFAPFFRALPGAFHTGLSMQEAGLAQLQGSVAYHQLLQAQQHLRASYHALFPLLTDLHSSLFPPSLFTFPTFLWAAELWYAYGMKVHFPEGTLHTCLVPIASLLNHSVYPHVTHFSRVDPLTRCLTLRPIRRVGMGEECTLSYGPLGNIDLMHFYGFVIDNNPYDVIHLDFPEDDLGGEKRELIEDNDIGWEHMVQRYRLQEGGAMRLPSRLMGMLRVLLMDEEDMMIWQGNPRLEKVSVGVEEAALQSLEDTLSGLLSGLEDTKEEARSEDGKEIAEVRLAKQYRHSEQGLSQSVIQQCLREKLMLGAV